MQLTTYTNDGLTFRLHDWGPIDGRPVIALHGFPQTSTSWAAVAARLGAGGVRVLAPDQRGYSPGARPPEVAAYRGDRLAGDVLALADAAGLDRFDLLGHDWGGAVAWHLAAWHSDRVRTLSVASTPHPTALLEALRGPQALRSSYMLLFQLPWLPEALLGGPLGARWMAASGAPDPAAMKRLLSDRATARGALNWYRALRLRGIPSTGRVSVPTLYVWSDHDVALDRRPAERTRDFVDGDFTFVELTGVSHWIPDERPDELAEAVLAHLDRYPA
jgi:pimeloyl-ACP methyl ester carboxylesterase